MFNIHNKKAQAALEFMVTYSWVFLSVLVTIGALFYFNVFDTSRYIPDECNFGQNIYCQDWSLEKASAATFDLSLMLKNNLERVIETVDVEVLDNEQQTLICTTAELYCPDDSGLINWSISTQDTFQGKWSVGRTCRLDLTCEKSLVTGIKEEFTVSLTFRRQVTADDSTNHTVQGKVYSQII